MHKFCSRHILISSLLIPFAISVGAQTATKRDAPDKAQALSTARGLMQQRVWAFSCPYKKENRESLDFLGMALVPALGLTPEELTGIEMTTGDAALGALSLDKEATCTNLEAQFEMTRKLMSMRGPLTPKPPLSPREGWRSA